MRIALTGGIACGKSLLSRFLREGGIATIDSDDIVHELIPEAERARLAREVFADPEKRRELEARIHPLVRERLDAAAAEAAAKGEILVEIIPLLFEVHWERFYDIIGAVFSPRWLQVERMVRLRGYAREQAEARLRAQLPAEEKAARAHLVVSNDSTVEHLKEEADVFIRRLKEWVNGRGRSDSGIRGTAGGDAPSGTA